MPALDATRRLYNPLTGESMPIPDSIVWIAAINSGAAFTGTTSMDLAQLDRFAPIKMTYPPPSEEIKLLQRRHPDVSQETVKLIVRVAAAVRKEASLGLGLSMRATEEACMLLERGDFEGVIKHPVSDVLKSSFCGRFEGHWSDEGSDAGIAWRVMVPLLEAR